MKIIMQYGVGLEGDYKPGAVGLVLMYYLTLLLIYRHN